jgi:predicted dehydrogenase
MKILIAGFGSIGRRHFHNLLALGERDILFLRSHKSTLPVAELAGYPIETDLEAALANRPKAVIISNPTSLHLDIAIPAAEAGCHLLIEKPLSHSMERVRELRYAQSQTGIQILVGYHLRFHPTLQRLKNFIEEGLIGTPLSVRAHWGEYLPSWHPWEDYRQGYSARSDLGGGVILTLSHPIDYLRWIFGEVEAEWAFSATASDLVIQAEDTAEIGLRFHTGLLGSLHLDYIQRPPAHWLEVIGDSGTIHWESESGFLRLYRAEKATWQEFQPPSGFERNDLFMLEMRHFLRVCQGQERSMCTLEDGIKVIELALAAYTSQELGQLIQL